MKTEVRTCISGKLGDTIASLASLYELNARDKTKFTLYLNATGDPGLVESNPLVRAQLGGKPMQFGRKACEFIAPLIKAQPYIADVIIVDSKEQLPSSIDINLDHMRAHYMDATVRQRTGTNLELLYKDLLGLPLVHTQKWLFNVVPMKLPRKVCVARSCRYTSAHLWLACRLPSLQKDAFFVGMDLEHEVMKEAFDIDLEHRKCNDAVDLAMLIAGSELFISNGTCAYWIAIGLGHRNIVHELGVDIPTTWYRDASNVVYVQGGRAFR